MVKALSGKKYSAIILSAGKSSRMGVPKFSLLFDKNNTFLEKLVNTYYDYGCEEIAVVLNDESVRYLEKLNLKLPSNVTIVLNHHPEWERFYSLKIAAKSLTNPNSVFVSNIDNPYLNTEVLDSLSLKADGYDYLFPVYNGKGGHPFLISEKVIEDLKSESEDQIHMKVFLGRYSKSAVAVDDEKVLANINTEEDYNKII